MKFKWKHCFKQIFREYCENTSIHGCKHLVEKDRLKIEKFLWGLVILTATSVAVYLFILMSENLWLSSRVTTLDSTNYHISNVPFPAVAICNINRISRKAAWEFAKMRHTSFNLTVEKLFSYLKWMGKMYDYDEENIEVLYEYDSILESRGIAEEFDHSRFIEFMLELTPRCSQILEYCSWKGSAVNCREIFQLRRTADGFCCIFNYVKSKIHAFIESDVNPDIDTKFLSAAGYDMGLTVLLHANVNDYYYTLTHMEGFKVYIFNRHDYPDVESGGLVESLIPLQEEVFLQIEPTTVYTVDELKYFPIEKRQCIFNNEKTTIFDEHYYSYSDCLSECKLRSILALCECIPFYMAISANYSFSSQICTRNDVQCLNKYKEKWMSVYPQIYARELETEVQNSLNCPECLPTCSHTSYNVLNEYSPLADMPGSMVKGLKTEERSLIHIYFDKESTLLYKTDLVYYWFDIISGLGGLCGAFIGFSLISLIELFHFFVIRYAVLLYKTREI